MAYISIADLPELQKDKMNGLEYLLVTNSNLESNKLKLETASDFIYDSVSEKIFTEFKDVLDMHESKIKADTLVRDLTLLLDAINGESI